MLHAVSLKLLCVQRLKTPHRLRPCDFRRWEEEEEEEGVAEAWGRGGGLSGW